MAGHSTVRDSAVDLISLPPDSQGSPLHSLLVKQIPLLTNRRLHFTLKLSQEHR
jgi:hypothetical protein